MILNFWPSHYSGILSLGAAAVAIISPYSVADCTLSLRGSTNSFVEVASMLRGSLVCATFDVNFLRRVSDNL